MEKDAIEIFKNGIPPDSPVNRQYLELNSTNLDLLASRPEVSLVKVFDLKDADLVDLVEKYGQQLVGIKFFKCKMLSDLSPLANLENAKYISFYWNIKAKKLWNMQNNTQLNEVACTDFTAITSIEEIITAPALKIFSIYYKKPEVSLIPLTKTKLSDVSVYFPSLGENKLSVLTQIPTLQKLSFDEASLTTEEVAWLRAQLPHVESETMAPYRDFTSFVCIVGKGKPKLKRPKQNDRIQGYVEAFEKLVEEFRNGRKLE